VRIGGDDVTMLPPYRRDVNTVFQNYALFPHMSAAENVAYGLRQDRVASDDRRKRVRDALNMVEMLDYAHRRPNELSGGQQQRIALARALVKRPSVLLLDEPLGALDRKLRQQMQVELKVLQNQLGLTFIFVTHDQEEALAMSDQIAVMRNGRVEQFATPTELYDEPLTAFVAGFIGAQNFLSGRRLGNAPVLATHEGISFKAGRVVDNLASDAAALGAVRPENVALHRKEPDGGANRLCGRVATLVMLGDTLEYVLSLKDGQEFRSRVKRQQSSSLPKPGDEVWVSWEPESFSLFAYEDLKANTQISGRS
jgi:spermidine/putrescine transport system ATP-binding protein